MEDFPHFYDEPFGFPEPLEECERCDGTGWEPEPENEDPDYEGQCYDCDGRGKV